MRINKVSKNIALAFVFQNFKIFEQFLALTHGKEKTVQSDQ